MTGALPRLVINYGTADLDEFGRVAEAAAAQLSDKWAVRMVVNHLAAKDTRQHTDPGDPYLEYSANFPDVFHFVVPDEIVGAIAPPLAANLGLADRKLAILQRVGLGAAFLGREPAYLPQALLARHPDWRGPRVDHPRRSRNPAFAPCLHLPETQELYREALRMLVARLPGVDTFFWWTNDSGSGFCWYPFSYPGPNGPAACRDAGPMPAMAAFHAAVLDGARHGGADAPVSIMTQTRVWEHYRMPAGAFRYPPDENGVGAASIRADVSLTYPIRSLWDPLGRLQQLRAIGHAAPPAVMWWLGDVYGRAAVDAHSAAAQIRLWATSARNAAALEHVAGRIGVARDLALAEFGEPAADDVVDAWSHLHDAFRLQTTSPFRTPLVAFLPTYGAISHRWLTRPLVAFPTDLQPDEEAWFLPHVFAIGDDNRRSNLLDVHGYPAAAPGEAHDLRSPFFAQIEAALRAAGTAYACAGLASEEKGVRLLASVWATCRNWLEFAGLRGAGVEGIPVGASEIAAAEVYRRSVFAVLRAELDNTLAFQELLGDDPEHVVARAGSPADEDTFTLSPDLQGQLTRKREVMLAHWQDVARLVPRRDC